MDKKMSSNIPLLVVLLIQVLFCSSIYGDCDVEYNEPGSLDSPNYPADYPSNANCYYRITAPADDMITLVMTDFDTEPSYDYLSIYDSSGPDEDTLINSYSGRLSDIPEQIRSSGPSLYLVFDSDGSVQRGGFSGDFTFQERPTCDANYTEPGNLTSPYYPFDYPNFAQCGYKITAPDNKIVQLHFTDFNTERSYDYLSIFDGPDANPDHLIGRYSGSDIPKFLRSSGQYCFLLFESDGSTTDTGFAAEFLFVDPVNCNLDFEEPGTISSPYYPANYPNNANCWYNITAPEDKIIQLNFIDFAINSSTHNCLADYISFFDENGEIGTFCGGLIDVPLYIRSTGRYLFVSFKSDESLTDKGFYFSFMFFEPFVCGQTYTDPGIISSPYFPTIYPNNFVCEYTINAPSGFRLRLFFTSFDLESSELCASDSLTLFDAPDGGDSEAYIGSFCGRYISRQIQSTGEYLFLRFKTNDMFERSGFNGSFEFVAPETAVDCGQQMVPIDPEQNIVGGREAQDGEWPWQAAHLISDEDDWALMCGASLINSEWLITAAHCINSITETYTNMYMLGSNTWPESSGTEQFAQVDKIFIHPNYSRSEYDWDLALIKLTHPVLATDFVRPVCIPGADMAPFFTADTMTIVTGWGATEETGPVNSALLEVDVPIIDPVICEWLYYPAPITENMVCAGMPEGGKDACEGDGGGPMVAKIDDAWYLPGVVSWGEGCAQENAPGVYSKVTAFEDWIAPVLMGGTPIEYTCRAEEFQCFDGWCADYNTKCNGLFDGCGDGSDEYYCDGYLQIFDAYPYVKLTDASVVETIATTDEEQCAMICLNRRNFTCFAFDIDYDLAWCKLAGIDFELESADGITSMNFHIGTLSESGSMLASSTGVFSTPKWLSTSLATESFFWTIQSENRNTRIQIKFLVVHESEIACTDPLNENDVIMRSGLEETSPVVHEYCLGDLEVEATYIVDNSEARVEFVTSDSMSFGFIAEYKITLTCDNDFTSPGDVMSPNYPQNYPDDSDCEFLITAPVNMTVKLTIVRFDVERSPDCLNDYLSVYNGAEDDDSLLIGRYCGDASDILDSYRSTDRYMYLNFVSDESINGVGFLGYFSFEPPLCFEQFESPGIISSTNYPDNYPTDLNCQYLITAPIGYRIQLIIDDFDVELTDACNKDHLIVYDRVDDSNEILGLFCGTLGSIPSPIPTNFESTERYLYLIFQSDDDITGRGFSGSFTFIESTAPPTGNPPTCGGSYDTPGTFYSPNYPDDYPDDANCNYIITAPVNMSIILFVEDFNLEQNTGCTYDSFSVYDAPNADGSQLIGTYCGGLEDGIPSVIQSTDRNIFVNFETDGSINYRGFQVSFLFSEPRAPVDCILNFTEPGNLTSPYYPSFYPDDSDCRYSIMSPPGTIIRVTVHDFILEYDPLCEADSLTAYNGLSTDPEQYIGSFCGTFASSQFESSGTSLLLHFTTNEEDNESGFSLSFEFVEPSAPQPCGMPMAQGPGQTVIGGGRADVGELPWMAAYLEYRGFWDYNCGASLISPDLVITAAHCISSLTEFFYSKIFFGGNKLIEITGTQQFAEVAEIFIHPNYTQDSNEWDVALIKLVSPVLMTDYVKAVCIPNMEMEPSFGAGTSSTVSGWGAGNSSGIITDTLRAAEIPIVDIDVCKEAYDQGDITGSHLCAGELDRGSCEGDDGGPLVSQIDDAWYLAGVVSYPYGCSSLEAPGVYAKVTAFEKWIEPALNGERPEEYICKEFQCYNGLCVDYILKCNGAYDGCLDGSDEIYCYNAYTVFDGFPYLQLDPNSVLETISTPFTDDCGDICLQHANFTCHAFDIDYANRTCKLAGANSKVIPADESFSTMHFHIIKMPEPGALLYSPYGTFASPNWLPPSPSQTTEYFEWLIMADNEDTLNTELQFKALHGNQQPCSDPSNTNKVTIWAIRGSVIYKEFELCLNEIEIAVPYMINGSAIVKIDFATTDPMNYGFIAEYVTRKTCGRYLDEPGTIVSPDYPSAYPNDALCEYVIKAPKKMQIQLVFEEFDIQRGINWESYSLYSSYYYDSVYSYIDYFSCPWDYLAIYDAEREIDGLKIGVYCGDIDDVPEVIQTYGNDMYLRFRSDSVGTVGKGFSASFTFVEPTVCHETLEEPAIITSPGYPNDYPDNFECGYTIMAPEGATVEFVIHDFELEGGVNWDSISQYSSHYYDDLPSSYTPDFPICPFDYVSIYDGPEEDENTLIGVYCGTLADTPLVIRSSDNQLYFKFHTDESVTAKGFQGFFTFGESVVCGGLYNEPGIIYSTGYPENYPADLDCAYTLRAPKGYEVRLTMLDFELEAAEFCTKDVFIVYDAEYADESAYIGTFCGTAVSSQFQSTNSSLYLRLRSDSEYEGRGFNARFEFIESVPAATCGVQTVLLEPESNVVGGKESQEGEWPWQAAHLVYMNDEWTLNCGATLLSPDWIITAAHCIYSISNPAADLYLLGTNDIERKSENHQYAEVEKIYIHPEYSQFGYDFDVALIKLTHPVVITDYVRTICVPDAKMEPDFNTGKQCITSGWGATYEGGPTENSLMEAEVEITDSGSCSNYYDPQPITDNMLCAGYAEGGKNPCQGDSGGPLMSKVNNTWYLPGVVSWGYGCARENYPGVYAKVTSFAEWIDPIFHGETPEEYKCSSDEYQCLDGWCVPYDYKCNGLYDGCNDGSDEMNCNDDLIAFDPFVNDQLTSSSVKETISAEDEYECATRCLNSEGYTCKAFDINHATKKCSLADAEFNVEASQDEAIVHYRMQPLPEPGSTLTAASGIIGTPNRLALSQPGKLDDTFIWIITANSEGTGTTALRFITVYGSSDCTDPSSTSEVMIRSGSDETSPIVYELCLSEIDLDEVYYVDSTTLRIEFTTIDSQMYGFLVDYTTSFTCNRQYSKPGFISSPMFPAPYSSNANCVYQITAPTKTTIQIDWNIFNIEWTPECTSDALVIYNGIDEDEDNMIGRYCGSLENVPESIQSEGSQMVLRFQSDGNVNIFKGFHASFTFVEIIEPTTIAPEPGTKTEQDLTWIYVGVGIGVGLLIIVLLVIILMLSMSRPKPRKRSHSDSYEDDEVYYQDTELNENLEKLGVTVSGDTMTVSGTNKPMSAQ